ncbi:hypothetical protein [Bradyrhizobium neotropicale]|nr:hypothetical protein [Bradyrhizobium neotropicale]
MRIVAEIALSGDSVCSVARRHGLASPPITSGAHKHSGSTIS